MSLKAAIVGTPVSALKGGSLEPIVVEGDLSILTIERRVVIDYFGPRQHDLADVIRDRSGARETFGVAHVGAVRITIDPIAERPDRVCIDGAGDR